METTKDHAEPSCSQPRYKIFFDKLLITFNLLLLNLLSYCLRNKLNFFSVDNLNIEEEEDVKASNVCFICDKERKKVNSRWQQLHTSEKNSIAATVKSIAFEADDIEMLEKLQDLLDSNCILK